MPYDHDSWGQTQDGQKRSLNDDGTVSKPSISFINDNDTGFYRVGAGIYVAISGVNTFYFDSNELIGALDDGSARLRFTTPGVTVPAFTFGGDNDTGMYRIGANILGFTAGGVERARMDSNGLSLSALNAVSVSDVAVFNNDEMVFQLNV